MTAIVIGSIIATIVGALIVAGRIRLARQRFIDGYDFPSGVRARVHKRYPHLTSAELDLVFIALREYFQLCRKAGKRMLAMPSQAVDAAWHEFILFTRNYPHFCRKGIGRFLHYAPAEAMRSPTEAGAGIKPEAATALPLLFAIDADLKIADGFNYAIDCTRTLAAAQSTAVYCGTHIGCGGGCGDGCSGGDGCGGGGGD